MKLMLTTAALALVAGLAYADGHSVVRLGTEGAYPPWNFLNDDGEVDGFERELGPPPAGRGLSRLPDQGQLTGPGPGTADWSRTAAHRAETIGVWRMVSAG